MVRSTLTALALAVTAAAFSGCCGYRSMCDSGCGIGGGRVYDGCDSCGPTGPCGPLRSGASYERTYRVPQGPLDHLACAFGGGCGETYWGEWISDPPDACDPCDQCGNWVGDRYCPEWMRYTRFVPWGYRDGCGCGSCGGSGCGVMKSSCGSCGSTDGCGCGGGSHVSYESYRPGPSYSPGCASCGH